MAKRYTHAFWRDAVRVALSSGLPRLQVSPDLGVGLSTLNKWVGKNLQKSQIEKRSENVNSASKLAGG
jgi:transposase